MQIVTDSGTDYVLAAGGKVDPIVTIVPLAVTLGEKTYLEGRDIQPAEFYPLLESGNTLPTTSQPSAGDFAAIYREIAKKDPEILSIHISSGLSGTLNSARAAAEMVPEAHITFWDTQTLSVASGWQVDAAAKALKLGWSKAAILERLQKIRESVNIFFTLKELKYLIHGGRISHIKGLLANLLQIKPIIGVNHADGKYYQMGQARTFQSALKAIADTSTKLVKAGSKIKVQTAHAANPEAAELVHELIENLFECNWVPTGSCSFVLGAHTGSSLVGLCLAPVTAFEGLD